MEDQKWFRAALIVSGDDLEPDKVTSLLGVSPTRVHKRGGKVATSSPIVYKRSSWLYEVNSNLKTAPAEQIGALLDAFEAKHDVLQTLTGHATIKIVCGFGSANGQGGFSLGPEILSRIAAIGATLTLDLYPPQELEDSE